MITKEPIAVNLVQDLYKVAQTCQRGRELNEAKQLYRLIILIHQLNPDSFSTGVLEVCYSLTNLAAILVNDDRFSEAEQLYLRAIAYTVQTLGDGSVEFARILGEYASLLQKMNLDDDTVIDDNALTLDYDRAEFSEILSKYAGLLERINLRACQEIMAL